MLQAMRVLFRVILPLMQPAELVQCIECGSNEYFISLLCLHVSTSFLRILSFGPNGLLKAFQGMLTLRAPRMIGFFGFTFQALIYALDQN